MRKTSLACDLGQGRLVKIERGAACMRKYSKFDLMMTLKRMQAQVMTLTKMFDPVCLCF